MILFVIPRTIATNSSITEHGRSVRETLRYAQSDRLMKHIHYSKRAKTPLRAKRCRLPISRGCSEVVAFGSEQGLSYFETAGIARYFEDFKRAKTPLRAKRCRF